MMTVRRKKMKKLILKITSMRVLPSIKKYVLCSIQYKPAIPKSWIEIEPINS